jgi:hypothetical protein
VCKEGHLWGPPEKQCPECKRNYGFEWRKRNPKHTTKWAARWREENPEAVAAAKAKFRDKNPDYYSRHYQKNKARILCQTNKYRKERCLRDPSYKLALSLRARTKEAFKGMDRSKRTRELLGCSWLELKRYLESKFLPGMTFENYGEWHIDHKIPLAKPLRLLREGKIDEAQAKKDLESLCHYTNLQPLWAKDNEAKGARRED